MSNTTAVTVTDMADIHPDLLSPGTIELALETRREYTKKLEEVVFPFILEDEVWLTSRSFILSRTCHIYRPKRELDVLEQIWQLKNIE